MNNLNLIESFTQKIGVFYLMFVVFKSSAWSATLEHPRSESKQVVLGEEFTCVVAGQQIKCLGLTDLGSSLDLLALEKLHQVDLAAAGYRHLCFQQFEVVYCLGHRHISGKEKAEELDVENPLPGIEAITGLYNVDQLTAGFDHTCARKQGRVYCFGSNRFGQLGTTHGMGQREWNIVPVEVKGLKNIEEIRAGLFHTCARSKTQVYCFGLNEHGQLGHAEGVGTDDPQPEPKVVQGLDRVLSIAAGEKHSCVVNDATLYCFGSNQEGQRGVKTGLGKNSAEYSPKAVRGLRQVSKVSAAGNHSCVQSPTGVYCFGYNYYGQTGSVLRENSGTATKVELPGDIDDFVLGPQHSCGRSGSDIYCFGRNWYGQLGILEIQKWSHLPIKLSL